MTVNDSVSANIKSLRMKRKLSQEKLAELAGCSKNHISAIERGRKFPSAALLDRFCLIFKVKPFELFLDNADIENIRKRENFIEYVMDSIDQKKLPGIIKDK